MRVRSEMVATPSEGALEPKRSRSGNFFPRPFRHFFGFALSLVQDVVKIKVRERPDEFSRGAPCLIMPPGVYTQYGYAHTVAQGRVHSAGTEMSPIWSASVLRTRAFSG